MTIIGELLYNQSQSGSPIESFELQLSCPDIAVKVEGDRAGYVGAFLAFKTSEYPTGELILLEATAKLNLTELVQVPTDRSYKLAISFPAWLTAINLKIWEAIVPQYPIFPTNNLKASVPVNPPTSTTAAATATQIAPARAGRNRLSIYNNSNGSMYVRYAATGTGTSATTSVYDEIIAAGNIFEYPGTDYPENAINAIWTVPGGVTLSGSCVVSEGIRG